MRTSSCDIVLVRHADVATGRRARMNGWHDVPLTPHGEQQALALRDRFESEGRYAAVYSSPLRRALSTARPLVEGGHGPLAGCPDAREIHCGEAEGLLVTEVQLRFPAHWAANLREDDESFAWPGGESYRAFRARCVRMADALAARHPGGRVIVVTHAGVVSTLVGVIRGTGAAAWSLHRPGNTGVTALRWSPVVREVMRFDDRSHLASLRSA